LVPCLKKTKKRRDTLSFFYLFFFYSAAEGNQQELVAQILHQGGDIGAFNREKKTAADLTTNDNIKNLLQKGMATTRRLIAHQGPRLDAADSNALKPQQVQIHGVLHRWTSYTGGGWKKNFFVVENGMLFLYNSDKEVKNGPRGTILLAGATILATSVQIISK